VMLTSGGFGPGTKRTVSDLRDHTLMSFKVDDVSKLIVKQDDNPAVEIDKQQGIWKIVKPGNYDADPERVRTILASLANARIDNFTSDNPNNAAQYGLNKPSLSVSVFTGPAQSEQSLEFGKKAGTSQDAYYVQRGERPNVYTVHNYVFADADKGLDDLRDRTVLTFDPDKVEQVKFTSGGKSFALLKSGDKWIESDGARSDADPVKVRQFIDRMHTLKAESIVQDQPLFLDRFGLTNPNEQVAFLGKDGKTIGSVQLAKIERHNGNNKTVVRTDYYARSSATPAVFKIFEYDYGDLMKTAEQFAAPKPSAAPKAKPTAAK
jgi:hypothetical protein